MSTLSRRSRRSTLNPQLSTILLFCAFAAQAFIHAQVGDTIPNLDLTGLDGQKHPLLTNATANVFFFLKPGQEHSLTTLQQIAVCEKDFAAKSVYWVAVVSDRVPRADVEREVQDAGLKMPVLIDVGDELYGRLGVALCPVAGIADSEHKLAAYQPFQKVNYMAVVRARISHLLKEISDDDLQAVLNPENATQGGDAEVARRHLKLAERQVQNQNFDKALDNIQKSLAKDPSALAAHILLGRLHTTRENWAEALKAFEKALTLSPTNFAALQGKTNCLEKLK